MYQELVIVSMKKSKTKLQSKLIFFALLLLIIHGIEQLLPKEKILPKKQVIGTITSIKKSSNKITLIISNKEKIQGTYYLDSKEKINLQLGDKVEVIGEGKIPKKPTTKNIFDYSQYLKSKKISYLIEIDKIKVIKKNKNILYKIKQKINNQLTNPYMQSFLLGDNSNIKEEVKTSYQENGISHLFAISGMQFYLLANTILKALKRLNIKEKTRYKFIFIFLLFYLFLLNLTASILRSILFFFLFSMNKIWKLKIKKAYLIFLAIIITIGINPYYVLEVGFWYSFGISIGLLYFIKEEDSYWKSLWKSSLLSFFLSIPISLYYFYQINIFSIFYNMFYIPYVNLIVFPMTILSFFIPIFLPIYELLIIVLEDTSLFLNKITIGKLIFKKVIFLVYVIEFILIILYLKKKKKIIMYFTIVVFCFHYISFYFQKDFIKVIDVGEGDSILIYSKGEAGLIDTGGKVSFIGEYSSSITKYTTIPLLKSLGIKKIKYALLTHGDMDHMAEIFYLNNHFPIKELVLNLGENKEIEKKLLKEKNKITISTQERELQIGNFTLYQLNKAWKDENNSSSIYYLYHENLNALFMGDAGIDAENYILNHYNLKVDILKLGHHGSKTSTSNSLLEKVKPKLAIISVGEDNRYHHPDPEVIDRLTNHNIPYLMTQTSGTITIFPKTKEVIEDKKEG